VERTDRLPFCRDGSICFFDDLDRPSFGSYAGAEGMFCTMEHTFVVIAAAKIVSSDFLLFAPLLTNPECYIITCVSDTLSNNVTGPRCTNCALVEQTLER
jgi:hypothetical protein